MQAAGVPLHRLGDPRHRLVGSDLVVRKHDADEDGPIGDCSGNIIRVHETVPVHRQIGHVKSELLQLVTSVQEGVMFDGRGNYVIPHILQRKSDRLQSSVV